MPLDNMCHPIALGQPESKKELESCTIPLTVLAGLSVDPISGCNTGFIGFILALFLL
jgi:hypothetical protein